MKYILHIIVMKVIAVVALGMYGIITGTGKGLCSHEGEGE